MNVITYPAFFTKEDSSYFVEFPDWEGQIAGFTQGRDFQEVYEMAQDVLGLICQSAECEHMQLPGHGKHIPPPGAIIVDVAVDMDLYHKLVNKEKRRSRLRQICKALDIKYMNRLKELK